MASPTVGTATARSSGPKAMGLPVVLPVSHLTAMVMSLAGTIESVSLSMLAMFTVPATHRTYRLLLSP